MKLQKSQPAEAAQLVPFLCLVGPSEKYGCTTTRKNARPRNARKSWQHFEHLRARPLRGDMKKRLSTKPGWGRTAPVCSAGLSGCTSS